MNIICNQEDTLYSRVCHILIYRNCGIVKYIVYVIIQELGTLTKWLASWISQSESQQASLQRILVHLLQLQDCLRREKGREAESIIFPSTPHTINNPFGQSDKCDRNVNPFLLAQLTLHMYFVLMYTIIDVANMQLKFTINSTVISLYSSEL